MRWRTGLDWALLGSIWAVGLFRGNEGLATMAPRRKLLYWALGARGGTSICSCSGLLGAWALPVVAMFGGSRGGERLGRTLSAMVVIYFFVGVGRPDE
jgi:hypothetical protein